MPEPRFNLASFAGGMVGGAAVVAALHLWGRRAGGGARRAAAAVTRLRTADPRSSGIVIHGGVVTISGQVGDIAKLEESDITAQTEQTLRKVDTLLAEAGSSKSDIIEARIWVKDIHRDFKSMNEVWNKWVDPSNKGCRFCVEANMARPNILVEIQVVAATTARL
mmetsp:Transcript_19898/g.51701  ORF Transcript_19898/g.51701 Transcript_19898/m.51701 type:complete len:165 (-) Transcript_19898:110-604(-)